MCSMRHWDIYIKCTWYLEINDWKWNAVVNGSELGLGLVFSIFSVFISSPCKIYRTRIPFVAIWTLIPQTYLSHSYVVSLTRLSLYMLKGYIWNIMFMSLCNISYCIFFFVAFFLLNFWILKPYIESKDLTLLPMNISQYKFFTIYFANLVI